MSNLIFSTWYYWGIKSYFIYLEWERGLNIFGQNFKIPFIVYRAQWVAAGLKGRPWQQRMSKLLKYCLKKPFLQFTFQVPSSVVKDVWVNIFCVVFGKCHLLTKLWWFKKYYTNGSKILWHQKTTHQLTTGTQTLVVHLEAKVTKVR